MGWQLLIKISSLYRGKYWNLTNEQQCQWQFAMQTLGAIQMKMWVLQLWKPTPTHPTSPSSSLFTLPITHTMWAAPIRNHKTTDRWHSHAWHILMGVLGDYTIFGTPAINWPFSLSLKHTETQAGTSDAVMRRITLNPFQLVSNSKSLGNVGMFTPIRDKLFTVTLYNQSQHISCG